MGRLPVIRARGIDRLRNVIEMTATEEFRLSLLTADTRLRIVRIISRMRDRDFGEPYVGSTRRTMADQKAALLRGTTGRKQTLSWHLINRAVDLRFRLPDDKPDKTTNNEPFFLALWEEATAAGCRCLGYVKDKEGQPVKYFINGGVLWDPGHVEYREPHATLLAAVRAEAPHLLSDEHPQPDPDDVVPAPEPVAAVDEHGLPPSPFS